MSDSGRVNEGIKNPFLGGQSLPKLTPPTTATITNLSVPIGQSPGAIVPAELVPQQDRRADLLWGRSKMGKGVNAWMGAYWVATNLGKKFLYLTAEPGSMPRSISNAVAAGMGDVFSVVDQRHLLSILSSVVEGGRWPVYRKLNDGTIIRDFNSREAIIDPKEYGLIIVDSLTSMGDEVIKWYTLPENKAVIPMTPGEDKFKIEDQEEGGLLVKYGGSSPTHIGEACRFLQRLVIASANLPLDRVLWIAREQRGSRGEKKDKQGNVLVAGEAMYGPDLPGNAATPRVTGWFGGAYHCDAVPKGGVKDDRPVGESSGLGLLGGVNDKLSTIPDWEYRIYLRPHPDPRTGLLYDAGNRFEAHLNADSKIVPPYIVCTERETEDGFIHTGLNTVWELEQRYGTKTVDKLRGKLKDIMAKFRLPEDQ